MAAQASTSVDVITKGIKEIEIKNRYLFLPDKPFQHLPSSETTYEIYLEPMNSSGDIYHIITYLMLSDHESKELPDVLLMYDSEEKIKIIESEMNTFTQTTRCQQFAKQLGFQKQFRTVKIHCGHRQNVRMNGAVEYLRSICCQNPNKCYIEQKLLTTLISYYFAKFGRERTVKMLKKSYSNWNVNEDVNKTIRELVQKDIQVIKKKLLNENKSLIFLHCRYSSKANGEQNLSHIEIVLKLKEYLESNGFVVWLLFVDSRKNRPLPLSKERIPNQTKFFPCDIAEDDYGKLYHLEFLLRVLEIKNLRGIIGNTSGCLDLAAFIGHNVLNLHKFSTKIDYQSYRIFLQSSFLTIEDFQEDTIRNSLQDNGKWVKKFNDENLKGTMPTTFSWIKQQNTTPIFPKTFKNIDEANVNLSGFIDLHRILAWKNNEDKEYLKIEEDIPVFDELRKKLSNCCKAENVSVA